MEVFAHLVDGPIHAAEQFRRRSAGCLQALSHPVRQRKPSYQPLVVRFQNHRRVIDSNFSDELNVCLAQLPKSVEMILGGHVAHIGSTDLAAL
jgi:hypothetical protein